MTTRVWFYCTDAARRAVCVAVAAVVTGLALASFQIRDARAEPNFESEAVVLAAAAGLRQGFWAHTVLLAAPLPSGGHLGVILNRSIGQSMSEFFPQHEASRKVLEPVYFGGPFHTEIVVALSARAQAPAEGTIPMGQELSLVVAAKTIDRIIEQTPNDARYFFGVVLWRPGELRLEFDRGLWTLHDADAATVFRKDTDRLWPELNDSARAIRTHG
jgi:putative AlgH/UPF0301 family transcriptional regulator